MPTLSRYLPHFSVDGTTGPALLDGQGGAPRQRPGGEAPSLSAVQPKPAAPTFSQEEVSLAVSQAVRDATAKLKAELAASEAARREDGERFEITMSEHMATARAEWTAAEADRLAATMTDAFGALEKRVSDVLGRILLPFVDEAMRNRALEEARQAIGGLLNRPLPPEANQPVITVRGPEDLLAELKERLGAPEGITFHPGAGVEIEATCGDTLIETRLGAWARLLTAEPDAAVDEGAVHG